MAGAEASGAAGGGFTVGDFEPARRRIADAIRSGLDDFDADHYREAYSKLALSGINGVSDALAKQSKDGSSKLTDPVDVRRLLFDTWLHGTMRAWDASFELADQYLQDMSNYVGRDATNPAGRGGSGTKATAKKTAAKKTAAKKSAAKKSAAKKATAKKTPRKK